MLFISSKEKKKKKKTNKQKRSSSFNKIKIDQEYQQNDELRCSLNEIYIHKYKENYELIIVYEIYDN